MFEEKARLEKALEEPVKSCRQHWLRFSWSKTWKKQETAGFKLDTTLGFNDRPGFRNGLASSFQPWDIEHHKPLKISAAPMILMDSHLYDYKNLGGHERKVEIESWINEIYNVHGTATIIWHQRTMSQDYGWYKDYEYLLSLIKKANKKFSE